MYTSVSNGVCMYNRYHMYTIFYCCNAVVCFIEYLGLFWCDNVLKTIGKDKTTSRYLINLLQRPHIPAICNGTT